MPMLDYQLNHGCLSDVFNIHNRAGLWCSCEKANSERTYLSDFGALEDTATFSIKTTYYETDTSTPATGSGDPEEPVFSLLDLDTHAIFLPLIQQLVMQQFARKSTDISGLANLYPQLQPDTIIIPPRNL